MKETSYKVLAPKCSIVFTPAGKDEGLSCVSGSFMGEGWPDGGDSTVALLAGLLGAVLSEGGC